ncbi:MAG TPA: M15 family metallopeptidase [Pyrinomonadaceae bacterium]
MKKRYLFSLFVVLAFGAVLSILTLTKLKIYGQSAPNSQFTENAEADTPKTPAPNAFIKKTNSSFPASLATAANENRMLKNSLAWTFGAKQQRGWYLYVPLIQQTVGTEAEAETPEFAQAISAWQQKFDLPASGRLDRETLMQMVGWWQARRLKSSRYPSGGDLVAAPIADFYDPSRAAELTRVERETYEAYRKMVAAAAKELNLKTTKTGELAPEEKFLRIVSSFRSREYQEKLRRASPNSGSAGLAVNSPHFTGRALDIYVGGEPTITKDSNRALQVETPAYKWLVKNAEKFGFYPYYYEPWHWEYVPNRAVEIK